MGELKKMFNKVGGLEILRQYMRAHIFFFAVVELLVLGFSRKALELFRLAMDYKLYAKLRKKYRKKIKTYMENHKNVEPYAVSNNKIIWVCWLQGMDAAPEIVKLCFAKLQKNLKGYDIRVITNDNFADYVSLPDFILQKRMKGVIGPAHFTDLIRVELLLKYGGTWIDSTVLCSSSHIPTYMLDSDLFVFQNLKPGCNGQTRNASNWFISAKPNNRILKLTLWLLYDYWAKHDSLVNYFIYHFFFQIALEQYPEEHAKIVPFSNAVPHLLQLRFFDTFDEKIYKAIMDQTPFHKLTYKYDGNKVSDGCYLDFVLRDKDG